MNRHHKTNEHILIPVLLLLLNVTVILCVYLGNELLNSRFIHDGKITDHYFILTLMILLFSGSIIKFKRRWLMVSPIALNLGVVVGFFLLKRNDNTHDKNFTNIVGVKLWIELFQ